jgi:hypothetical protein
MKKRQVNAQGVSLSLKPFSKKDVDRAATAIMRERGDATTLDVKLKLRSEGLFAEQQAVSEAMKQLAWISTDHLSYK